MQSDGKFRCCFEKTEEETFDMRGKDLGHVISRPSMRVACERRMIHVVTYGMLLLHF